MALGVGSLVLGSNASLTSGAALFFAGGRGGCAPPESFPCEEAVDGRVRSLRVAGADVWDRCARSVGNGLSCCGECV
jgi:hypothetical protein